MLKLITNKMLLPIVKKLLKSTLEKEEFKNKVVDAINDRVDVPKLTEEQERYYLETTYEMVVGVINDLKVL